MRLTVRTLLAWIDETLAPEHRAELGEKVAASGVAPRLVERINTAVAHPAVSIPPIAGRGLADDPNTAAEFLDNALDPERLEAFERICVESDAHLADVSACHRMLAELAQGAAAVDPPEPSKGRDLLTKARARAGAAITHQAAAAAGRQPASTSARSRDRRAPLSAWLSAGVAMALLLGLAGFFVWSVARPARKTRPTDEVAAVARQDQAPRADEAAPPPDVAPAEESAPAPAHAAPPPDRPAQAQAPVVAQGTTDAALPPSDDEPASDGTSAPPDRPAAVSEIGVMKPADPAAESSAPTASPPADQRVPRGDALAIVAPPEAAAAATRGLPAATDAPGGDRPAPARGPRAGGPLLHRGEVDGKPSWLLAPADQPLADREDLIAPPWCHPTLVVDGITIRLEPGTRAVLDRDADGTPTLDVVFGRAVVSAAAADARVGIVAGGLRGTIAGVLDRAVGIEVRFERDPGRDSVATRRATVHAGLGDKIWRQAAGVPPLAGLPAEFLFPARASLVWDERDPAAAMLAPPMDAPWLAAPPTTDRLERSAVRSLEAALEAAPDGPVEAPLRRLLSVRRPEDRSIAAATMALLGDYEPLVTLLSAEPPLALGEASWAALEEKAVPLAIARGENSAAALAAAFRSSGPAGKGDLLMALAYGFSDDELAAGADRTLVESLDDASLAVRRFAFRRLVDIVPPDVRRAASYRADRPEQLRKDGSGWWKTQLEQRRIRRGAVAEPRPPAGGVPRGGDDE